MSDNRLYIISKATGNAICLAKSNGSGWYSNNPMPAADFIQWLNDNDPPWHCDGETSLVLMDERNEGFPPAYMARFSVPLNNHDPA